MNNIPGPWEEHKAIEDQNYEEGSPNPGPTVDQSSKTPWVLFLVILIFIFMALAMCKGG